MNKIFQLCLIFVLIVSLFVACQKGQDNSLDDIKTINNEDIPQKPSLSISFKEDFTLRENWIGPAKLLPDDKGNLFVFDEEDKNPTIYKFNNSGELIQKKSFNKGQGPGDFNFMDPDFSSEGKLCIFDKLNRRLTILDNNLEFTDSIKLEKSLFYFRLDSNDFIYGFYSGFPDIEHRKNHEMPKILAKFSPEGGHPRKIFEYSAKFPFMKDGVLYIYLYGPSCIFKIDESNNIYYAETGKYEINIFSPSGKMIKKISKKTSQIRITPDDLKDSGLRQQVWGYDNSYKWQFAPASKYKPCIEDFFILNNGYLLVLTYDYDESEHETILADLFDERGVFLTKVEVPKYSFSYACRPDYFFRKSKALEDDFFYTIETDEDAENYRIKRYKMTWQ